PRLRVPDLQTRVGTDHRAVAGEPRVLAQRRRDRDAPLLVGDLVGRAREEDPAVAPYRLLGDRRGTQSLGNPLELRHGEDVQAALLALRDHQSPRQLLAVLRRQEQPSLVVEARGMGAEEHRPHLPCRMRRYCSPRRPTLLHSSPPSTLKTRLTSRNAERNPRSEGVGRSGARRGPARAPPSAPGPRPGRARTSGGAARGPGSAGRGVRGGGGGKWRPRVRGTRSPWSTMVSRSTWTSRRASRRRTVGWAGAKGRRTGSGRDRSLRAGACPAGHRGRPRGRTAE